MSAHRPVPHPEEFAYELPRERIALTPAQPRDSARLLVYHPTTESFEEGMVRDLARFLPPRTLLVVNATRVVPARLALATPEGQEIHVLLLPPWEGREVRALAPKTVKEGDVVRHIPSGVGFAVRKREGKEVVLWLQDGEMPLVELLRRWGEAPLPPYLARTPLPSPKVKRRYQSVFARHAGSVAAPTASLHFTPRLIRDLRAAGHELTSVVLHVGLGTFAPLGRRELEEGRLHAETFAIGPRAARRIRAAQEEGRAIVAVGTTALRTLETVAQRYGAIRPARGSTELFIYGTFSFRVATGLLTNFHVPRSSLLMLVDAFLGGEGRRWRTLYEEALRREFRFLSFGDACLLWRP